MAEKRSLEVVSKLFSMIVFVTFKGTSPLCGVKSSNSELKCENMLDWTKPYYEFLYNFIMGQ